MWLQSCLVHVLHCPKNKCSMGVLARNESALCAHHSVTPAMVLPEVLVSSSHGGELKKNRVMCGASARKSRE